MISCVVLGWSDLGRGRLEQWDQGGDTRASAARRTHRARSSQRPRGTTRTCATSTRPPRASIASIAGGPCDLPANIRFGGASPARGAAAGAGELFLRRFAGHDRPTPSSRPRWTRRRSRNPRDRFGSTALQIIFDALMLCTSGAALDAVAPYRRSDGVGHGDGVAAFRALEVEVKRRPAFWTAVAVSAPRAGWV